MPWAASSAASRRAGAPLRVARLGLAAPRRNGRTGVDALALTNLDGLDQIDPIRICRSLRPRRQTEFSLPPATISEMERAVPVYETLPAGTSISGCLPSLGRTPGGGAPLHWPHRIDPERPGQPAVSVGADQSPTILRIRVGTAWKPRPSGSARKNAPPSPDEPAPGSRPGLRRPLPMANAFSNLPRRVAVIMDGNGVAGLGNADCLEPKVTAPARSRSARSSRNATAWASPI